MAKISTNSNSYTLIYAVVMVIVVAFLLAFAHSALSEMQDNNVKLDTKKQILSSLNIQSQDANADFSKYITNVLDASGKEIAKPSEFNVTDKDKKSEVIYKCNVEGQTKYIIPLRGNGLWGPIWGYVAVNDDKSTIYGVYFGHESETAGLGAEIVTDGFKAPFKGKQIVKNGKLMSVAVVKKGQTGEAGQDYVDGISGGTITSSAVSVMLQDCFKKFENFLTSK